MKGILLKGVGTILMLLAFLQWATFDYPDMNPFWPGLIFSPGAISQVLNWLVVAVLGATGYGLYSAGRKSGKEN